MKLFGWGKSKNPQQPVLQQVISPDWRNVRGQSLVRGTPIKPILPSKSGRTETRKQQGLLDLEEDGYHHDANVNHKVCADKMVSNEKLRETIRFVFSNEQEGLLAIGTFALDQLAMLRDTLVKEGYQNEGTESGFESCTSGAMLSSDDEEQLQWSWVDARKTCDLPVYGSDVYIPGGDLEADQESRKQRIATANQYKALTLHKSKGNRTAIAGVKPIVLLTTMPPEFRKALDPVSALLYSKSQLPNFAPHWTDHVPPPQPAKGEGPSPDDEYHSDYSSRLCGLFTSKRKASKSSKSKNSQKEVALVENKDKKYNELSEKETKKSVLKFGTNGVPSIGKLAKFWRSSCKQSSARIAPEKTPCSPRVSEEFKGPSCTANGAESGEVLTTPALRPPSSAHYRMSPRNSHPTGACSPKVAEFRRRVAMHERVATALGELAREDVGGSGRDDFGHWVKTDSEFVVLEM
ncbi:uncharacterized protein [Physcomitrium patens]|uniref:Uncharacterized protein n=2 Tax=Physcomitrium patens TaxID=3218 RepID=A0A7I4BKC0_PHYPA|nr:uncharacterized protein LOC112295133 isoform X2 [Physcomitrium patens]|eukprot:XP_024402115.1 uncharacterized protein LOC112295133 isoform X2 [Physcomitrella patens]